MLRALLLVLLLAGAQAVEALPRSTAAKRAFVREHPCPAGPHVRGACPGFVVDHVVPLCAGGADAPGNMQWQTVEAGKVKDREERRQCRAQRPGGH